MSLFRRDWRVTVGGSNATGNTELDVSNLDIEFHILRTLKKTPNKASITVWNLSEDHRAQVLKRNQPAGATGRLQGVPVKVSAGYVGNVPLLMNCDLMQAGSVRDGTNWKTIIAGDDGGRPFRESRVNITFTAGQLVGDMIKQVAEQMGVGKGNADKWASAAIRGIGNKLPKSMTVSGNGASEFNRLLSSCTIQDSSGTPVPLTWSIQNGALQILPAGTPLDTQAIKISPSTGLIGSPEPGIDSTVQLGNPQNQAAGAQQKSATPPKPKDPGIVKIRTLMIPGMEPGRKITLESDAYNGSYMLTECEYRGQTFGRDWYIDSVARAYK